MGKSEVVPMPMHRQDSLYEAACKGAFQVPINTVAEEDETEEPPELNGREEQREDEDEEDLGFPENMEVFANQVAGHTNDGKSIGMIKHKGTVLKPITNQICGDREIRFYQQLKESNIEDLVELREFVPNFYGSLSVNVKNRNVDCIVLDDLTRHYKEPCVMDVKIGRRTWDPLAGYKKIMKEETKYADCKRDLAFCIPGFQVYKIQNNQLIKYDKDYGKNLSKETVPQALKTFLNGDETLCRRLIVQFLACLWRIQLWARKQRHLRLYSSSLLFVYDARRLRESIKTDHNHFNSNNHHHHKPPVRLQRSTSLYRPLSLAVLNKGSDIKISTGFSGQLTKEGPILKTPTSTNKLNQFDMHHDSSNSTGHNSLNRNNVWQKSIRQLKRTHSFQHNYDEDVQNKKQDYASMLDDLCTEQKSEMWAQVKMIDFAHAFPSEHHELDRNYLDGIENLTRIFEEFLMESQ